LQYSLTFFLALGNKRASKLDLGSRQRAPSVASKKAKATKLQKRNRICKKMKWKYMSKHNIVEYFLP
jgi:hypothetical protein